jgi:CRISPR/Cas system-associated protein endoribonuclease Cas2
LGWLKIGAQTLNSFKAQVNAMEWELKKGYKYKNISIYGKIVYRIDAFNAIEQSMA